MLSPQDMLDLRKRVLSGGSLSLDEARSVIEAMKGEQAVRILAGDADKKPKRGSAKKAGISDQQLDSELDAALGI